MNEFWQSTYKWTIRITFLTFVLAAIFSIISNMFVLQLHWLFGVFVVLIIIFIGVVSDTIGIAATSACEKPFHAMAANKVEGAKVSIRIVRNADQFSNFCNDVIGDIAGIISGAASAAVIIQVLLTMDSSSTMFENVLKVTATSIVAALTVGGKAIGKAIAIKYSQQIISVVGKILNIIEKKFNIKFFDSKNNKKKAKRGDRDVATNNKSPNDC
ncbi:hypothetical protein [Desulfuribacillus alkaliarsenatis]|uniref:Mg2+ and Co2+ transporter CorB n=1 Tax=Desulfuribacillus alkaliarsenatis TaxID=766136 RepID=A0A1E5G5I6_9FIRM|nr:hypothetical protein [Desulfuribacillus alkaliarsenatis]OEF98450.1 hypothetical protein BHF68_01885 [Desulfuribacillus alkaliarsenatis]